MTLNTTYNPTVADGNGVTKEFSYNFNPLAREYLKVSLQKNNEWVEQKSGWSATVSENGGIVTFDVAPTTRVSIERDVPEEQPTQYKTSSGFQAEVIEHSFDLLTGMVQELKDETSRSIKVEVGSSIPPEKIVAQVERVYDSIDNIDTVATDKANVDTVATNISKVNTTANNINDVKTVADNINDVKTVAKNIADVNIVATDIMDVVTVSGISEQTKTVAENMETVVSVDNNKDNINAVNANKSNIDAVAANATNINNVAANATNINNVVANEENINKVSTNLTTITDVAEELPHIDTVVANIPSIGLVGANVADIVDVAQNATNINAVAGSIANVNTVANDKTNIDAVAKNKTNIDAVADNNVNITKVANNQLNIDKTADNMSAILMVNTNKTNIDTVATNIDDVQNVSTNMEEIKNVFTAVDSAKSWATGTLNERPEGSSKYWANEAKSAAQISDSTETTRGTVRLATDAEAKAGLDNTTAITPKKLQDNIANNVGRINQLGFNGVLESGVITFTPDQNTYELKEGYEYEIDLLFSAVGKIDDDTQLKIVNGSDTINIVNVLDSDYSKPTTYKAMKQVCRYDTEVGWRWIFNVRYSVASDGSKVFVMPATTINSEKLVSTDTAQNISGMKNFINSATSSSTDAHSGMSISLQNSEADLTADTMNSDGTVDFKYQGLRMLDKNGEEMSYLYSAPDGVGGSFTRLGTSAKVNNEYVDSFIEMEVDANGKSHCYIPEVDTDSTVSKTQAATVGYVQDESSRITSIMVNKSGDTMTGKLGLLNAQVQVTSSAFNQNPSSPSYTTGMQISSQDGVNQAYFAPGIFENNDIHVRLVAQKHINDKDYRCEISAAVGADGSAYTTCPASNLNNSILTTLERGGSYVKLGNGLIISWGWSNAGTVTFPVAFSNIYYQVALAPHGTPHVYINNQTTTGFTLVGGASHWIAMGY